MAAHKKTSFGIPVFIVLALALTEGCEERELQEDSKTKEVSVSKLLYGVGSKAYEEDIESQSVQENARATVAQAHQAHNEVVVSETFESFAPAKNHDLSGQPHKDFYYATYAVQKSDGSTGATQALILVNYWAHRKEDTFPSRVRATLRFRVLDMTTSWTDGTSTSRRADMDQIDSSFKYFQYDMVNTNIPLPELDRDVSGKSINENITELVHDIFPTAVGNSVDIVSNLKISNAENRNYKAEIDEKVYWVTAKISGPSGSGPSQPVPVEILVRLDYWSHKRNESPSTQFENTFTVRYNVLAIRCKDSFGDTVELDWVGIKSRFGGEDKEIIRQYVGDYDNTVEQRNRSFMDLVGQFRRS